MTSYLLRVRRRIANRLKPSLTAFKMMPYFVEPNTFGSDAGKLTVPENKTSVVVRYAIPRCGAIEWIYKSFFCLHAESASFVHVVFVPFLYALYNSRFV
jgi:hypothetical protein